MVAQLSVVGTRAPRVDGVQKVTGAARYAADILLPGMLYGKIKRSPHPHARVLRVDGSRARALSGVKAVLTIDDVPRVLHAGAPAPRILNHIKDQYIFDTKVRFVGDGLAAVAAISEEIAEQALDLIAVEYELLPAVFDAEEAMQPGAPLVHETDRNLVVPPIVIQIGDIEQGFAEADYIVEEVYTTGRPAPTYMEPNACVAQFDNAGNLIVWASTQGPFMVRGILAEVLGIPVSKVRVICEHMGGGFGAKQDIYQHEFICALLAQRTGRPVKMEYTREECFLAGKTRHPVKVTLKQGFTRDGRLTARQMRYVANGGAYCSHSPGITEVGCWDATSLFRCENFDIRGYAVYTNNPVAGAFRGYGAVQSLFALNCQMDGIARTLGIDPVDFMLQNVVGEGDLVSAGHRLHANALEACLRRGAEEIGWYERHLRPRQDPSGIVKRGWGVGVEMHSSGASPFIKEQSNAILKMNEDGTVHLLTGVADLGTGALTVMAQIAAETLGIPYASVRVTAGDTDVTPFDIGAYASRTTFVGGGAVAKAAADLRTQLLALAAEKLGASADALEVRDGVVFVSRDPGRALPVRDVVKGEGGVPGRSLMSRATGEPDVAHSFAAHFAEVDVDTETGQVKVIRVVAVHEVGKAINPMGVEGQIEGGLQQGIGHTLTEDLIVDPKTGRTLNANLVDYKMLTSLDMPATKVVILELAPDPGGPFGAKGVAEDPLLAIGPAIANAVADAIGVRIREYPITPEKVLRALRAQQEQL